MGDGVEQVLRGRVLPAASKAADEASAITVARPRLHVLVVDDNNADADLITEYLTGIASLQFDITRATRLRDAIAAVATAAPNIILLDLGLPDSQGPRTVEQLRSQVATIPVVVLTGHDDADVASAAIRLGAQDFLVKGSFDHDSLARTLRHALERHQGTTRADRATRATLRAREG